MMHLPDYVANRIRQKAPADAPVVPGSTPVVGFGHIPSARVATVGHNPSRVEFLDKMGRELSDSKRRLQTIRSLGVNDLQSAPTERIEAIYSDCLGYFQRNPYRTWFDQLECVLGKIGASYYDGSACHLDLVQWATDPVWGKLPGRVRSSLLAADADFLLEQLRRERIDGLLVNGRGVLRGLSSVADIRFTELETLHGYGYRPTRFWSGRLPEGTLVIAWSTNLQSSVGVSNAQRFAIGEQIQRIWRAA